MERGFKLNRLALFLILALLSISVVSAAEVRLINPGDKRVLRDTVPFMAEVSDDIDSVAFFLNETPIDNITNASGQVSIEYDTYDIDNGFYDAYAIGYYGRNQVKSNVRLVRVRNDRTFVKNFLEQTKDLSDRKGGLVIGTFIFIGVVIFFFILFVLFNGKKGGVKKRFRPSRKKQLSEDTFEPEIRISNNKKEVKQKKQVKETHTVQNYEAKSTNSPPKQKSSPKQNIKNIFKKEKKPVDYGEIDRLLHADSALHIGADDTQHQGSTMFNIENPVRNDYDSGELLNQGPINPPLSNDMLINKPIEDEQDNNNDNNDNNQDQGSRIFHEEHVEDHSLDQLKTFIQNSRNLRVPDQEIKNQLVTSGWPEHIVTKYLN